MDYNNLKIESNQWGTLITKGASILGVDVNESQVNDIKIHAKELLKWNNVFNLTSITKPMDIAVKHFLDSLAVVPFISKETKILDIGSGAGFPGIPLKILLPNSAITLMEASRKKASFLKYLALTLKVRKISVVHANCERLKNFNCYAKLFDVVICRALSNLENFIRIAFPFLSKNGTIIALKGKLDKSKLTLDGVKLNTCSFFDNTLFSVRNYSYRLPVLGLSRNIVFVRYAL